MLRSSGMSERNARDVITENNDLKKFHEQMKRDVRTILSRHEAIVGRVTTDDSTASKRVGVGRARANRTGDVAVTGSLKKQWNSLKQLVEVLEARVAQSDETHVISVTDHEKELTRLKKEVEELREELEQSRELISQQQQLLQDQLVPQPGEGQQSPMWDAYFLEEQLRLQQDRAVFEEQKMAFQDERDKFTEAAIRLGRERLQFKADQALYMKQQFLNMTPGLETPPWKKTPPWSALAGGTPGRTCSNPRKQFTPGQSCGSSQRRGLNPADPKTPSTAELYRVLRLAPPSRSMNSHTCDSSSQQDTESEESSQGWSDSLSPRSESPELQPLPQFVIPFKLSMTPYLRPRPTPASVPRTHAEPRTPSTAELFRALHLTPAESIPSGKRGRGDELRRSLLQHSHRRVSISKAAETPCCNDNVRRSEEASHCPYEFARADCDMDSLSSEDSGQTHGEADTPNMVSSPKESSECFDNDSLYRVTPLHETTYVHHREENLPRLRVDTHYCGRDTDQSLWQCQERDEDKYVNRARSNSMPKSKHKETLQVKDRCRSRSRENLHPQDAFSRSRSQERLPSKDQSRTRSKEDLSRKSHPCHQPKAAPHFEDERNEALSGSQSKRRRSLDSLHHKHGCKGQPRESHSLHRRSSRHRRDSLYTSGPGRSPLHFRRSCPSVHNAVPWTSEYVAANLVCADLLTQFLDCSF
ncbi:serine/threonine-protein kinase fray2-like [Dendropsophus ebraccatus]|uniref:serine/threonine-protein kinase fray2-like n=1 Tax=Dendropsophus ebraccatus TaxID=150705 RepID=UPI0038316D1C